MADVVDAATRRRMMSGIRGSNTKPELQVRGLLHSRGFRYRLHVIGMPARPDIVLSRWRAVVLVHGCFWHGHDCHLFKLPSTREEFWRTKIEANTLRDVRNVTALGAEGWRVGVVHECALKGRTRLDPEQIGRQLDEWLHSDAATLDIAGFESQTLATA